MIKNIESELVESDFIEKFGRPEFGSGFEDGLADRFTKAYRGIIEWHLGEVKEQLMEAKRLGIVCVTHFTGIQTFNKLMKGGGGDDDLKAVYMSH